MNHGPNVRKLITTYAATLAIPAEGGLVDAIQFLTSGQIGDTLQKAERFVVDAIMAVRLSKGLKYATWNDEQIAELILKEVEARKARHGDG